MSEKYKIREKNAYFQTMTVVGWIDVFTRPNHKLLIIKSLEYYQKEKGLSIFGYCLMPSHLLLLARADGANNLSEILRDFKKFTAKAIINQINEEPESHREWMLKYFEETGEPLKRITHYKFWQDGNQAKEIYSKEFFYEKLNYMHNNPIEDLVVQNPEDYLYSSARNYASLDSYLSIIMETTQLMAI